MAVLLASVAGVILGAPTLRLRGDYLAIVTLGFGEIARIVAQNSESLGASRGISSIPHPTPMLGVEFGLDPLPYYYLTLVAIGLAVVMIVRLKRSRVGRAWAAIREDEDAAEAMGVPTFKMKLWAFAIGASTGGLGGWIYASRVSFINPDNFPFFLSVILLSAVVLGGMGSIPGVVVGAFAVAFLPEYLRDAAAGETLDRLAQHHPRRPRHQHHRVPGAAVRAGPGGDDDLPAPGLDPQPAAGGGAGRGPARGGHGRDRRGAGGGGGRGRGRRPTPAARRRRRGRPRARPSAAAAPSRSGGDAGPPRRASDAAEGDDGARARRAADGVRRGGRPAGDRRRRRAGRDPRPHRAQRGGQDDGLQLHHRGLPSHRGRHPPRRGDHLRRPSPRGDPGRRGPHVPEHPPVPQHDGPGERDDRGRLPPPHQRPRRPVRPGPPPAGGAGEPGRGPPPAAAGRHRPPGRRPGPQPALRRPAPAGDRPGGGHPAPGAPARRARGRAWGRPRSRR